MTVRKPNFCKAFFPKLILKAFEQMNNPRTFLSLALLLALPAASRLHAQSGGRLLDRVASISESLLGKPFADGPLGEGKDGEFDSDPLWDSQKFDCTTYVETVLARAISTSSEEIKSNLNRIRYRGGVVSYETRNHFPDADWIPNNTWLLEDITERITAPAERDESVTVISKAGWYAKATADRIKRPDLSDEERATLLADLRVRGEGFVDEEVRVPYIKLSALFDSEGNFTGDDIFNAIPNVAVMNIVRPNWNLKTVAGTNMSISHQGILIRKADGLIYLRHASASTKAVSEVLFSDYLKAYLKSPTIKGFNVLALQ